MDLFSVEVRRDPYPIYRDLRTSSPVVHLAPYGLWMILDYEGYEVLTAATGDEGIKQTEREAPDLVCKRHHLGETALRVLHELVGQEQCERLVADELPRAPHGVAQAQRLLLAREARSSGPGEVPRQQIKIALPLALAQRHLTWVRHFSRQALQEFFISQRESTVRIREEHPNVRQALEFAIGAGDGIAAAKIIDALSVPVDGWNRLRSVADPSSPEPLSVQSAACAPAGAAIPRTAISPAIESTYRIDANATTLVV